MVTLQFKRGPEASIPNLSSGEPGVTTDTEKLFVGMPSGNTEMAKQTDLSALSDTVTEINESYISNSQINVPGGVAGLGENGALAIAQGGTGAKTPQEALVNLGAASNPNLLDNWYFVGGGSQQGGGQFPINQRGKTSYSPNGHTIDRWTIGNGIVLSLQENGLQMQITNATYLKQQLENPDKLQGQTVTLSGVFTNTQSLDGVVLRVRVNKSFENRLVIITGNGLFSTTTVLPDSIETMSFEVGGNPGSQLTITALKLELGPVQTLAHQDADGNWVLNDPPPNFQQELAKCQRYAIALKGFAWIGMGVMSSATDGQFFIPFPVSIRSLPAFSGSLHVYNSTNNISATVKGITGFNANGVNGTFSVASGTFSEKDFVIVFLDPGESCLFSADL